MLVFRPASRDNDSMRRQQIWSVLAIALGASFGAGFLASRVSGGIRPVAPSVPLASHPETPSPAAAGRQNGTPRAGRNREIDGSWWPWIRRTASAQRLLALASFAGFLSYFFSYVAAKTFYEHLGVSIDEIGSGYTTLLTRAVAGGFVITILIAIAFVMPGLIMYRRLFISTEKALAERQISIASREPIFEAACAGALLCWVAFTAGTLIGVQILYRTGLGVLAPSWWSITLAIVVVLSTAIGTVLFMYVILAWGTLRSYLRARARYAAAGAESRVGGIVLSLCLVAAMFGGGALAAGSFGGRNATRLGFPFPAAASGDAWNLNEYILRQVLPPVLCAELGAPGNPAGPTASVLFLGTSGGVFVVYDLGLKRARRIPVASATISTREGKVCVSK